MSNIDFDKKTDEELVELTLKNQDDFLYLMRRYEGKMMRFVGAISNFSREDKEDLVQDIFLKVYKNLNSFDSSLKFSAWIYRIARNQVIDFARKLKRSPQSISFEFNDEFINNIRSDFDMKKEIEDEFLKKNLGKALSMIKKEYREALVLYFLEEKSYQEISDITQRPIGTVATLVFRAKKELRNQVKKNKIEF